MPTIRNILNVQGSKAQAAALLDFISDQRYGRGSIDFNQVTPMPPWVYRQPTNLALLEKYGEGNCARGWCLENWGTPQNALHPERSAKEYDGGTAIHFDTEDREVRELVRKLSLIFRISTWTTFGPARMWAPMWGQRSTGTGRPSLSISPHRGPERRWKKPWTSWEAGPMTTA